MSILTENIFSRKIILPLWHKLDGKKTATGAASLLFWLTFYGCPAMFPQYNWITQYGTEVRDFLIANGVQLDNFSFNSGVILSVLGLLDKFKKAKIKSLNHDSESTD